jgi:hypothetical protein
MNRFDYLKFDPHATNIHVAVKSKFEGLAETLEALPDGRAKSLALTKLEEAFMWAGKAVRDDQVSRQKVVES